MCDEEGRKSGRASCENKYDTSPSSVSNTICDVNTHANVYNIEPMDVLYQLKLLRPVDLFETTLPSLLAGTVCYSISVGCHEIRDGISHCCWSYDACRLGKPSDHSQNHDGARCSFSDVTSLTFKTTSHSDFLSTAINV
jgi:hypothetical protein